MKRREFGKTVAAALTWLFIHPVKWETADDLRKKILNKELESSWVQIALYNKKKEECKYLGYQRVKVPRTEEYWDIYSNKATNKMEIKFPACTGNKEIIRYTAVFLHGKMRGSCKLDADFGISEDWSVSFASNDLDIELTLLEDLI